MIVISIQTPNGELVIKVDQAAAKILIDGDEVEITPDDDPEPITIRVVEGPHTLEVTKGGFVTHTEAFKIVSGEETLVEVELIPVSVASAADRTQTGLIPRGVSPPIPALQDGGLDANDVDVAAERAFAQWLLETGGYFKHFHVKSLDGKNTWTVSQVSDLPDEPFTVSIVYLVKQPDADGTQLLAELIPRLTRLEDLQVVANQQIGHDIVPWLTNVDHLERLSLRSGNTDEELGQILNRGPEKLRALDFYHSTITDVSLERLSSLTSLEELNVVSAPVTDAGVQYLSQLPNLRSLHLSGTKTTGRCLEYLSKCDKLEYLDTGQLWRQDELRELKNLSGLKSLGASDFVTDEGMTHLRPLIQLTYLNLRGNADGLPTSNSVTDAGLENILGMTQLAELRLTNNNKITDQGLRHFDDAKQLTLLDLAGTSITNTGLEHIAKQHPFLERLYLSNTQVNDEGLNHLAEFRNLGFIDLCGTKVTAKGLTNLKRPIKSVAVAPEVQAEWNRLRQ